MVWRVTRAARAMWAIGTPHKVARAIRPALAVLAIQHGASKVETDHALPPWDGSSRGCVRPSRGLVATAVAVVGCF